MNAQAFPALTNARDISLAQGGASPAQNVETILYGSLDPIVVGISTKRQNPRTMEFDEVFRWIRTQGSVQPLKNRDLEILAEGDRRWTWMKVFALANLLLEPRNQVAGKAGDAIKISGVIGIDPDLLWRVMGSKPWAAKGYSYYEIVPDFQIVPGQPNYAPAAGPA